MGDSLYPWPLGFTAVHCTPPSVTTVATIVGFCNVGNVGLRFVAKGLVLPQVPYPVNVQRLPNASFTEVIGFMGIAGRFEGLVYVIPGPGLVSPVGDTAVACPHVPVSIVSFCIQQIFDSLELCVFVIKRSRFHSTGRTGFGYCVVLYFTAVHLSSQPRDT